jgi:hypothetical protein
LESASGNRADLVLGQTQDLQVGKARKDSWRNRRQTVAGQAPLVRSKKLVRKKKLIKEVFHAASQLPQARGECTVGDRVDLVARQSKNLQACQAAEAHRCYRRHEIVLKSPVHEGREGK